MILYSCFISVSAQENVLDSQGRKQGKWITKDEKDRVRKECYYVNDTLEGPYLRFFSNGKIYEQMNFRKGKLNGLYRMYLKNKYRLLIEREFNDDVPDGFYRMYDKKGNVLRYVEYKDGLFHGKYIFYLNGVVVAEAELSDGYLDGKFVEYYPKTSNPKIVIYYKEGEMITSQMYYNKEGIIYKIKLPNHAHEDMLESEIMVDEKGYNIPGKDKEIKERPVTYYYFLGKDVFKFE